MENKTVEEYVEGFNEWHYQEFGETLSLGATEKLKHTLQAVQKQTTQEIVEWVKNAPKLLTHASMQDAIENKPKRETLDANDLLEYLNNK